MKRKNERTDARFFLDRLSDANASKRAAEIEKAKQVSKIQINHIEEAKEKYLALFAQKNIEYVEAAGDFFRLREDGRGYYKKPWHIYVEFEEEEPSYFTVEWLKKNNWKLMRLEDGRFYIKPFFQKKGLSLLIQHFVEKMKLEEYPSLEEEDMADDSDDDKKEDKSEE